MTFEVAGQTVDDESRCVHYDSSRDVVAIKFACCETYYPCYQCHEAAVDHPAELWPANSVDERAVLCGVCEHELSIREYVTGDDACPDCGAAFNPGCRNHYQFYFDISQI